MTRVPAVASTKEADTESAGLRGLRDEDREGSVVGIEEDDLDRARLVGLIRPSSWGRVQERPLIREAEVDLGRNAAIECGVGRQ